MDPAVSFVIMAVLAGGFGLFGQFIIDAIELYDAKRAEQYLRTKERK